MSRRPHFLLALAVMGAWAAVAVWAAAFAIPGGRELDAEAMLAFTGIAQAPRAPSIEGFAHLANPLPFVLGAAALVGFALMRRRPVMAAVVPAILIAANGCTQILKPTLADPRIIDLGGGGGGGIYPGSWPSGHATAAMSLALCLVLVVGPRLRRLAAVLGAAYAIGVGYALVAGGWHLPSDVLGGYLVAATFTLLGGAALAALERRRPVASVPRTVAGSDIRWPAMAGWAGALVLLVVVAAIAGHPELAGVTWRHIEAVLAAVGIAVLGAALTGGLAVALRR